MFDVMQAWLGPQSLGIGGKPYVVETLEARLGPSAATIMLEWPSHLPRQWQVETPTDWAPLGSVN